VADSTRPNDPSDFSLTLHRMEESLDRSHLPNGRSIQWYFSDSSDQPVYLRVDPGGVRACLGHLDKFARLDHPINAGTLQLGRSDLPRRDLTPRHRFRRSPRLRPSVCGVVLESFGSPGSGLGLTRCGPPAPAKPLPSFRDLSAERRAPHPQRGVLLLGSNAGPWPGTIRAGWSPSTRSRCRCSCSLLAANGSSSGTVSVHHR
jgi:hypothetical protein